MSPISEPLVRSRSGIRVKGDEKQESQPQDRDSTFMADLCVIVCCHLSPKLSVSLIYHTVQC